MTRDDAGARTRAEALDAAIDDWLERGAPAPSPVLDDLLALGADLGLAGGERAALDRVWARSHPTALTRLSRVTMRVAAVWIALLLAVGVLAGQRLAREDQAELTRSATEAIDDVGEAIREVQGEADAGRDDLARERAQRAAGQVQTARERLAKLDPEQRARLERRLEERLRDWPDEVPVQVPPPPPLPLRPTTTLRMRTTTTLGQGLHPGDLVPDAEVTVPDDLRTVPTTIEALIGDAVPDEPILRSEFDVTPSSDVRLSCGLDEQGASRCDVGSGRQ